MLEIFPFFIKYTVYKYLFSWIKKKRRKKN